MASAGCPTSWASVSSLVKWEGCVGHYCVSAVASCNFFNSKVIKMAWEIHVKFDMLITWIILKQICFLEWTIAKCVGHGVKRYLCAYRSLCYSREMHRDGDVIPAFPGRLKTCSSPSSSSTRPSHSSFFLEKCPVSSCLYNELAVTSFSTMDSPKLNPSFLNHQWTLPASIKINNLSIWYLFLTVSNLQCIHLLENTGRSKNFSYNLQSATQSKNKTKPPLPTEKDYVRGNCSS